MEVSSILLLSVFFLFFAVTGGNEHLHFDNRYSTFVNWELWWPNFPVLVYFKETQTKPEGQVHFFPVIFVSYIVIPSETKLTLMIKALCS